MLRFTSFCATLACTTPYFLIRSLQPPPKKQTSDSECDRDSLCRLRMVLASGGAMIRGLIPPAHGEREGKAALVGWDAAHLSSLVVGCCVCVCFFFVSYLSGRESKLSWPIFAPSFHKICAQRQPISMLVQNLHNLVIMDPCLLVGEMHVLIDLSGRKKCTKILLGRVPSYFFSIVPGFF
jgi:hypothetical protein